MPSTITDRLNGLTASVAVKAPCRVATTANITLSGEQTIDGVAVVSGDRVLVKSQTSSVNNGIYVAATSTWTRAADFDGSLDLVGGTQIHVISGTVNANTYWKVSGSSTEIVIGTDAITFVAGSVSDAAGVTFTRANAGAVSRSVSLVLIDAPLKLEDFGGATTASAATNDAAWALLKAQIGSTNTKSIVQFLDGTYNFTAAGPDLPSAAHQITLQGYGKGRTKIKWASGSHGITLPTTGTPHSITIRDMTLDGSATAAAAGNGIHHGGSNDFFGLKLERVDFDNIANNAVHLPSTAFTFHATGCDVNSTYGHGFHGNGNTWKFDTCYVHTLHTANKAGWRITGGTVVFENCNGVDTGTLWADLGQTTTAADTPDGVADAANGYCYATFIGCNLEDFTGTAIHVRNGGINLYSTAIVAPSSGTVKAINGQFSNSQGGVCDRHPDLCTTTKGASWANSVPIHSRSGLSPFGMVGTNNSSNANAYSFYNESGAVTTTVTISRPFTVALGRLGLEMKDISVSGILKTGYNGTATLAAGTAAVTFGTARPSATYRILLTGGTAETFTWASKATTGFTINSSNGASTASVDWFVVE